MDNPNACLHGGECIDNEEGLGFTCHCHEGFSGAQCEVPPDFCKMRSCPEGLCVNNYELMRAECICEGEYEIGEKILSEISNFSFVLNMFIFITRMSICQSVDL